MLGRTGEGRPGDAHMLRSDNHGRSAKVVLLVALALVTLIAIGIAVLSYVHLNAETQEAQAARREAEDARRQSEEDRQRAEAARQQAEDERQRAEAESKKARTYANEQRLEATRLAATLALDRGLTQCEQGEAQRGLLWLARGLEAATGNPEFQGITRRQLSAWSRHTHTLRAYWQQRGIVRSAAFSPDGKMVLIGGGDEKYGEAVLWNTATSKAIASLGLPSSQFYVAGVAFSPDGKTCVTGGLEIT